MPILKSALSPPLVMLSTLRKAALNLRQMGGSVLAACGLIHLNPSWINGLLRELLDHRLADPKKASCLVNSL